MATTWTNSSLMTNQHCGEQYRRIYEERDWCPSSANQTRGTVVHKIAAKTMTRKWKEGTLPTVEEVRDLTSDAFTAAWDEGIKLQPAEQAEGENVVRARVKDTSINLAVLHREVFAPGITPIGVEHRIVVKPADMNIEVVGTMDLVAARDGGAAIHDLKTSEKAPSRKSAEISAQFTMYGLLWLAKTGKMPIDYEQDWVWQTPARKELKHDALHSMRDQADLTALVARLNASVDAVGKGVYVPASPDWWGCSPEYCQFWDSCVYTRRGARPQS